MKTRRRITGSRIAELLLLAAQGLTLIALLLGLVFVLETTGGTLFLFSALAPVLVGLAILIVLAVAMVRYHTRHRLFEIQDYEAGDIVFVEGDPADSAYFIHSGEVEVLRTREGRQEIIARLGKDAYFGEMALMTNAPRNATIRAATQLRVAVLGQANFQTLLSVLPTAKEDILKTVHARALAATSNRR